MARPDIARNADQVSAASVGEEQAPAPETRRSGGPRVTEGAPASRVFITPLAAEMKGEPGRKAFVVRADEKLTALWNLNLSAEMKIARRANRDGLLALQVAANATTFSVSAAGPIFQYRSASSGRTSSR
jgi:hypothetical protein